MQKDSPRDKVNVTLAGKYRGPYFEKIKLLKKELIEKGIDVLYPPEGDMSEDSYGFFDSDERTGDNNKDFARAEMYFIHQTFQKCDAIIICNYDGYIGQMTSKELYFFTLLIATYDEKKPYNTLNGYIPIYLLEDIDIEAYRTQDELGCFATYLDYGMEQGLIKVGLNSFYDDYESGQLVKMKIK